MKNSIKTNQTAGNYPRAGASRTIVKFIALLTLLNWAVAVHFVSAAEVPGQQQAAQATPIPWNEIGAAAGKQYQGDGLAVAATEEGARLHCVFQKLEGHATRDGLWLVSTTVGAPGGRFRVTAQAVGRAGGAVAPLPGSGTVRAQDTLVRFERPGLTEEYSASLDGIRQDFVIAERPAGAGGLCVELAVAGARAEPVSSGAKLVLEDSGRQIAYSRLRVVDATGRELAARMEVPSPTRLTVQVDDADAAYPVRIDPTFSDSNWIDMGMYAPGADNSVNAIAVDGSGNIYLGGAFSTIGTDLVNRIAKWNGSAWSALGSGLNNTVNALAVSGADLYVGGIFTTAGGVTANRIAKWNGSAWSALGSGVSGTGGAHLGVNALAVSGTDLYAAGWFTAAGGAPANRIAKWDGSGWSALGSGVTANVNALAVLGTDLYVGGAFTTAGGAAANYIAKWNGSGWSALSTGVGGNVNALAASGTDLYVGGVFTTAGGLPASRIAKWNGSGWSGLASGVINGNVLAIAVSGADLYVGGALTTAGGAAAPGIAKWNGSVWSGVGSGVANGTVNALAVSGTDLYVGGAFTTAGGAAANYIAKWNGSGWSGMSPAGPNYLNNVVAALAVSGTDLYVGGDFTTAGGAPANRIAKWNGSAWSALGLGVNSKVNALAVSGTDLYVGGNFTTAGGAPANYIAKWNGSAWSALGSGLNFNVNALAVSGTDLYVGGDFSTAGGAAANRIAKWNGSVWSALGTGVNGSVLALAVSGTDLYVGGFFNAVAKWNGSAWSTLGSGVNNFVNALAVSGPDLYAGGNFNAAGGAAGANFIAKWNGSAWSAVGSGVNFNVYALAISGTDLYVGGSFTTAGGAAASRIAKWNGSAWSALGSGVNVAANLLAEHATVYALALSGTDLYVGGDFSSVGTIASSYLAKAFVGPDTAVVTLGSLSQTYTGSGLSATATTIPTGLAVNFSYNGSATLPVNVGSYTVVGTINDANYQGSATGTLVIGKATTTVALANLSQTYTGNGLSAAVTTTPAGLSVIFSYNGSPTLPIDVGSYTVVGTINDANYQGSATGTLVIGKATTTVALANLSQTYTGNGLSATATTTPTGLSVNSTYDGSATFPVAAGSYAVVGTISDANYQGSATGTLVVGKATATVSLANLSQTYTGSGLSATATTTPTGLSVNFTYDGSATFPVAAGSYAVVGTINDANYQGSATGTLVIGKATATVTLANLSQTYTGSGLSATATTTPTGLSVNFTYDGSATFPVAAGSYAVVGTINDANYQGSATGTLVIGKATATVTLANLSQTYTGSGLSATATTTPTGLSVNFTYDGSATFPVAAASYAVVGTINDANYQGSATGTLVIGKATATVALANLSQTYTGSGLSATATTTPTGISVNFTYNGSVTLPVNAGSYAVVSTINDANYQGSAIGTLVIGKATATVALANLSQTYTGSGLSATATTTPTGLSVNFTYNGSVTLPVNAGSYAVVGTINNANYQGSATGTLVIGKATATVTLANLSHTYTGNGLSATATTTPTGLSVNFTYNGSVTLPVNVGSYAVVSTINDANYQGSAIGTLVIGKATATVTLANLNQTYTGSGLSATVTTTPTGLTVGLTYDGSALLPVNVGSYAVAGTINNANYQGSVIGTLVIGKATAMVTLANLSQTYTGSGLSATATTTPTGLSVNFTYNGSVTLPVNVGSHAVVSTINDANYQGSATGTLVIGKATATVTLANLSHTYTGSGLSATATTTPTGLSVNFTYNGSVTLPVNVGSYAVVSTINDANYQGSATGTLVIGKATATVTLGNLSQTYTGSGLSATATTTPTGLSVNLTYNGSVMLPVDAGSYTVAGTVNDANYQGSATGTLTILQAGTLTVTIDGPDSGFLQTINTTVNLAGSFTPAANTGAYSAYWTVGDATDTDTVIPATLNGFSVSGQVQFTTPGVYSVKLTVADGLGTVGEADLVRNDLPAYVVIYDPNGGYVTGGGWINSPAGAFHPDLIGWEGVTGKATFGFVSRYKKGANLPTGNTEFQFKAGNLTFKSTAYQWLTVAGARAQYKGWGTINDAGDYGFLLTAIDGALLGTGNPDRFRIKIWENDSGIVVYDNQSTADNADLTTAGTLVAGGSIVIHKDK